MVLVKNGATVCKHSFFVVVVDKWSNNGDKLYLFGNNFRWKRRTYFRSKTDFGMIRKEIDKKHTQ